MNWSMSPQGTLLTLQHHVGSTLSEVQAGTCGMKGSADVVVENLQGVEAIEMKQRQRLRAACYHDVGLASLDELRTEQYGIGT